jgi:hypothetical protein
LLDEVAVRDPQLPLQLDGIARGHSIRRTKVTQIYKKTGNLRTVFGRKLAPNVRKALQSGKPEV